MLEVVEKKEPEMRVIADFIAKKLDEIDEEYPKLEEMISRLKVDDNEAAVREKLMVSINNAATCCRKCLGKLSFSEERGEGRYSQRSEGRNTGIVSGASAVH